MPCDTPTPTLTLTIRPEPRGRDAYGRAPEARLKGLLKSMLRQHGWRCVSASPIRDETADTTENEVTP